jgi:mono/diheme cytochrome c family protein
VPFPESPMPPWRDALNQQQLDAVVALVESWAREAGEQAPEDVPNTVEGGQQVFTALQCHTCHGANLEGGVGPNLQTIGSELVTEGLPTPPSGLDQMIADYEADKADFLAKWIRDSWSNYNGGTSTGMPQYPESALSENNLQALITFLLAQSGQ